jgi:hypothetical protein
MRAAALAAAVLVVFLPAAWMRGQHGGGRAAPRAHEQNRPPNQSQPSRQSQGAEKGNAGQRPYGPPSGARRGFLGPGFRPAYPGPANGRNPSSGSPVPPYYNPRYAPPGHLEDWVNRHHNLPFREQEQLLRGDPSFKHLPPANQQRLLRQLQNVDQMSPQMREWRLARVEAIEHLSPQARQRLAMSSRNFAHLPPARRALVKRAFQQLRLVPVGERQTELNSARYRGLFTPEERQILSNFLSVEPYMPPAQSR